MKVLSWVWKIKEDLFYFQEEQQMLLANSLV
jgi:hypothetical protein